jgi:hypothetical protein
VETIHEVVDKHGLAHARVTVENEYRYTRRRGDGSTCEDVAEQRDVLRANEEEGKFAIKEKRRIFTAKEWKPDILDGGAISGLSEGRDVGVLGDAGYKLGQIGGVAVRVVLKSLEVVHWNIVPLFNNIAFLNMLDKRLSVLICYM